MNVQEFSPYNPLQRVVSRWWIVLSLMISGALVGFGFHFILPPIYEASAIISVNLDFPKAILTQTEEDDAFNSASGIINSSSVMNNVIAEAAREGFSLTPPQFHRDFYLEGRLSVWSLLVRERDPKAAAALANIWAQISMDALNTALTHALQADQLQTQINGLENCLAGVTPRAGAVQQECQGYSHDVIQSMLLEQTASMINERKLSLGILSITTFGLTDQAVAPGTPVVYGQGGLVLAGAFLGFFISLWAVNLPKVSRRA
jgi:hypothetical protein